MDCIFVHNATHDAKSISFSQANRTKLRQIIKQKTIGSMEKNKPRPFADISERIKWHREKVIAVTQGDYAESIGVKRSALSLWEAGSHRLSLDGALALRRKYGLSLDFLYEGIDDALPMTLRNAWQDKP